MHVDVRIRGVGGITDRPKKKSTSKQLLLTHLYEEGRTVLEPTSSIDIKESRREKMITSPVGSPADIWLIFQSFLCLSMMTF